MSPSIIKAATQIPVDSEEPQQSEYNYSLKSVIRELDRIFDTTFDENNLEKSYNTTEKALNDYFIKIYATDYYYEVRKYYYNTFYDFCEKGDLGSAVNNAFKYLMVGGHADEDEMYRVLIENYGSDADTKNTQFLFDKFKAASKKQGDCYSAMITALSNKYADVLHPQRFEDIVKGTWVALQPFESYVERKDYEYLNLNYLPAFILDISRVNTLNGVDMIFGPVAWSSKRSGNLWHRAFQYSRLRESQSVYFNGNKRELGVVFSNKAIDNPSTEMAKSLYTDSREFSAGMQGTINSTKGSFGEKALATTGVTLVSSLMNLWANKLSEGSVEVSSYNFNFAGRTPKVMDAQISFNKTKFYTNGTKINKEDIRAQKNQFVKWEPSDSVIFFVNEKPMFVENIYDNSPLLDEYHKIKKRYSCWRAKYLIPNILIIAAGGAGMAYSIKKISECEMKEDSWYPVAVKKDRKKYWWSYAGIMLSFSLPIATISTLADNRAKSREKAFREINRRSMNQLRQKARISISPSLDLNESALGMNLHCTF